MTSPPSRRPGGCRRNVQADRSGRDQIKLEDFERLIEAIPAGAPNALRDRALLEVLFATGCRLSELCGLTRRRVNLKTREVEVLGKGKKVRGPFLTATAAERLARYLATRKDSSPYVFVSRQSVRRVRDPRTGLREARTGIYPLAPKRVQALVKRLGIRAGLPADISPHWFRHGRLTIVPRRSTTTRSSEARL